MLPPSPGALQPGDGHPVLTAAGQPGVKGKPEGEKEASFCGPPPLPAPSRHLGLDLPHLHHNPGDRSPAFQPPPKPQRLRLRSVFQQQYSLSCFLLFYKQHVLIKRILKIECYKEENPPVVPAHLGAPLPQGPELPCNPCVSPLTV